jgi:hypothetical protein
MVSAACARAQGPDPGAQAARLSDVDGQVQISQGDQILANQAMINAPLFQGTTISTAEDGRAEIQFNDGSVARIPPNSALTLSVLRQQDGLADTEIVLNSGLGYFELQGETSSSNIRVRFGDSMATVDGFTVLRIDLDNPPGELAVFSGNVHLQRGSAVALDMHGGESVTLSADDPANYSLAESIEPDSWDAWNSDRDQALTTEEANRTAATNSQPDSNNPAWSDLDASGNWYNVPGQGYVWSPYEAQNAGWDPYGCGNWMWTPQFGYIWVSCESWGFLPFQMGMWNYYSGFGWGWAPGVGMPWWGTGGWGYNIGNAPLRYHPPDRPNGGPARPRGGPVRPRGGPIYAGGRFQPYPVLAVNRLHGGPTLPHVRDTHSVRTIAGNEVRPLKPLEPRSPYNNSFVGGTGRATMGVNRPVSGVGPRYGYMAGANAGNRGRQSYWDVARPAGGPARSPATVGGFNPTPTQPRYNPRTVQPTYNPRPSGPVFAPRPSAPSHGYSGGGMSVGRPTGGGGGGYHGGGGGGGGSHGGGGGGGHR